jgi:hypothetical protein
MVCPVDVVGVGVGVGAVVGGVDGGVVAVVPPTSFASARSAEFGVPKFCVTNTTL